MALFYTAGDATPSLELSPIRIKQLIKAGVLRAVRTVGGIYLIEQKDLEQLVRQRAAARETPVAGQ